MRICATGASSIADPADRPPLGGSAGAGSESRVRHDAPAGRVGGPGPDVVLLGAEQEAALGEAVADMLARDGLAARVVVVASGPQAGAHPVEAVEAVAPPGVPRVTICGDCPETPEGIRLAAHDAVAAGTQGW